MTGVGFQKRAISSNTFCEKAARPSRKGSAGASRSHRQAHPLAPWKMRVGVMARRIGPSARRLFAFLLPASQRWLPTVAKDEAAGPGPNEFDPQNVLHEP